VPITALLLFIRTGLNSLDQGPRSAFIAAVVKPSERTAVMGITSMLRTLAATIGPTVTGLLAGSDKFWIAFVVAGVLRLAYDFGLWALFVNMKLYEHEEPSLDAPRKADPRHSSDEEELHELAR
jgi:MFS family permease